GSAVWRTEPITLADGTHEIAIRADIRLPERRMTASLIVKRNTDRTLSASHIMDISFAPNSDLPGGIREVAGVLMKPSELVRGLPLSVQTAQVTQNLFLIGLSAAEGDQQRNLQLLKERGWFDIPIVYGNGRRAILALAKGETGEASFKSA